MLLAELSPCPGCDRSVTKHVIQSGYRIYKTDRINNLQASNTQKGLKIMKKIICILLALLLLAGLSCTAFAAQEGVQPGDSMPDFTVALSDGTSATLSELLKGNDLVVLNVFATWCGPCKLEFPEMEKTYQAHSDRMVILSVSGDPADTREMIAAYKEENALSFPMGMAGDALDFLDVTAYPTTVFIDRDGKVGFYKVGSFVQEGDFEAKVNTFLSDDYDGKPLESEIASGTFPIILLVGAALAVILVILLVIGRWCLFRKAGKPGWHSIIPILSTYQEYAIGWKGWVGLLSLLCGAGASGIYRLLGQTNASFLLVFACVLASFVLHVVESFRLAKAFGKKGGTGILLVLFRNISRFFLGVGKARYLREE